MQPRHSDGGVNRLAPQCIAGFLPNLGTNYGTQGIFPERSAPLLGDGGCRRPGIGNGRPVLLRPPPGRRNYPPGQSRSRPLEQHSPAKVNRLSWMT